MGKELDGEHRSKRSARAWNPISRHSFYVVISYSLLGVTCVEWLKYEAQSDTQSLSVWRPLVGVM